MNISDFKFPKYMTGIENVYGEWLLGGYDFQTQAAGIGWTRATVVNDYIEIHGDEIPWENTPPGPYTVDKFPIFTFPNGYQLKMTLSANHRPNDTTIGGFINWYDENDTPLGEVQNVFNGYTGISTWFWNRYGYVTSSDFKIVVYLCTRYYPTANPPTDTPCVGIALMVGMGFTSGGFDWHIGVNNRKGVDDGEVSSNPVAELFFLNLDNFAEYLHTHGDPYSGYPFSDEEIPGEPAGGGDTSGTGGGGGNYDPTSDPVNFPTLPTGGALTSGMIKGFLMNSVNIGSLQNKLWDMSFFDILTQYQKLINDPIDCIISLHCLPFAPVGGNAEEIKLGSFPTGVSANRINAQYAEVDGGTIHVDEYWGSALDYAPYTDVEIYVPFIGFKNLKIEDIQGLDLALKYHVDVMTGDCVAYLKCGNAVLYSWTGNCKGQIPCTSSSNDLLARQFAPLGAVGLGIAMGNPASAAAGAISGAVNSATAKNHVQRSGDVSGYAGLMSEFNAYLVFHRPRQSLAKNYKSMRGYACNITYKLSQVKGFTMVDYVHLKGISGATDTELAEIETLLKEGVII